MKPEGHISKLHDSELLRLYKAGEDRVYIAELYRRYSHLVFGTCLRYLKNSDDAKDALLSVFEKLITDLSKYEINDFQHWIYSVSKHYCFSKLREKDRSHFSDMIEVDVPNDYSGEISQLEKREMLLNNLESAIEELNNDQKTCVTMFYLEKKSYRSISDLTGMSMNEIKSHIQNGRRNLALMLKEES